MSKLTHQSKNATKARRSASLQNQKAHKNSKNTTVSVSTQTNDVSVNMVDAGSSVNDEIQTYLSDTSLPFHSINNLELSKTLNLEHDSIAKIENQSLRKRLQKLQNVNKQKLVVEEILGSVDEQLSQEREKNKTHAEKIDELKSHVKDWRRGYKFEVNLVELMWKHKNTMKKTIVWLENKLWGKSKISAKQCKMHGCEMKSDRCYCCGKQAPGSYCKYCKEKLDFCFEHYNDSSVPWQQEIPDSEEDDDEERFPPVAVNFVY